MITVKNKKAIIFILCCVIAIELCIVGVYLITNFGDKIDSKDVNIVDITPLPD